MEKSRTHRRLEGKVVALCRYQSSTYKFPHMEGEEERALE